MRSGVSIFIAWDYRTERSLSQAMVCTAPCAS
jgi:hypothetical protein